MDIRDWMTANHLILNEDKTKFLIMGTRQRIAQCNKIDTQLNIMWTSNQPNNSARNIGVLFDSNLSLAEHINNILSPSKHLRNSPTLEQ